MVSALCAPGRAAKCLSEATGGEAKTTHRLLEVQPTTGRFGRNEANLLDCDLSPFNSVPQTSPPSDLCKQCLQLATDRPTVVALSRSNDMLSPAPNHVMEFLPISTANSPAIPCRWEAASATLQGRRSCLIFVGMAASLVVPVSASFQGRTSCLIWGTAPLWLESPEPP